MNLRDATSITIGGKAVASLFMNGKQIWPLVQKTWTALSGWPSIVYAQKTWTDGTNTYCSFAGMDYKLVNDAWQSVTFSGTGSNLLDGMYIWTDGTDIYYSNKLKLVKSNGAFTTTWTSVNITGLSNPDMDAVWTDGTDTYFSYVTDGVGYHYKFNATTMAWTAVTFTGCTAFTGLQVWHSGNATFLSTGDGATYQLTATRTWTQVTFTGLSASFSGNYVWHDSGRTFLSVGNDHYELHTGNMSATSMSWQGLSSFNGLNVFNAGDATYYANGSNSYKLA